MRVNPKSESEAREASRSVLLKPGWHDARIDDAADKLSKAGNDMIELGVAVAAPDGSERIFRDWLTASDRGALKLRNACIAVGAQSAYEAGEISAADFPGHAVRVKLGVEKRRGYPDRNVIEDYAAAPASGVVTPLRAAG
jgi:hypothetical protein